jgi:uncharacterized protein YjbI with pentapeptide repeats
MNKEHYDIIKQGVDVWDKWREENPDERIDLLGANLRGASLIRADLTGADLTGADLIRANLCKADLSGANLRGADLSGADLRGANLSRADLRGANLSRAIGIRTLIWEGYNFYFQEGVTRIGCYSKTNKEWLKVDVQEAIELGVKEEEYEKYKSIFLDIKF